MNAINDAIAKIGGVPEFAKRLAVSPQAVFFWRTGQRKIPADRCPDIERLTGVRCEALRPDVAWGFLRGTPAEPLSQPDT